MSSTHLYQIFHLHKIQSLSVHCKPNDRFLNNTHSEIEWWKMICSNKIPTIEIHRLNYLLKVSQITSKPFNNTYKPILSNITSTETNHLMCTENEVTDFYRKATLR